MRSSSHYLFFSRDIDNSRVWLDADEARHARKALRLHEGDEIRVTDGAGTVYQCRLEESDNNGMAASIVDTAVLPRPVPAVTLCVALPERDRFEETLHLVVPQGVCRIIPTICEYCQDPWWESWEKHAERFTRKMTVAIKQAMNPYLPQLDEPAAFERVLGSQAGSIVYADETGRTVSPCGTGFVTAFVGPPGGFSPSEITALKNADALPVRLGHYRLRTELAAALLVASVRAGN